MKRRHHDSGISVPSQVPARHHMFVYIALGIAAAVGLSSATPWPAAPPARAYSGGSAVEVESIDAFRPQAVSAPHSGKPSIGVAGALISDPVNAAVAEAGAVRQAAGSGPRALENHAMGPDVPGTRYAGAASAAQFGSPLALFQLMPPVATRTISSPFGWRQNPTGPGRQIHIGQDYPIACGSPVRASEDGVVVLASWAGHSGNRVTIDHGNRILTGYSHNSLILARAGQKVSQGQVIALAGTTGNSTGCHVHFEVIANGHWQDPRLYLGRGPGDLASIFVPDAQSPAANFALAPQQVKPLPAAGTRTSRTTVMPAPEPKERKATQKSGKKQQPVGSKAVPHKVKPQQINKTKADAPRTAEPRRDTTIKHAQKPQPSDTAPATPPRTSSPTAAPSATPTPTPSATPTRHSQAPTGRPSPTSNASDPAMPPNPTATASAPQSPTATVSASPEPSQVSEPSPTPSAPAKPSASSKAPKPVPSAPESSTSEEPKDQGAVPEQRIPEPAAPAPATPKIPAKTTGKTAPSAAPAKAVKKVAVQPGPRPARAKAEPVPAPVKSKAVEPATAAPAKKPAVRTGTAKTATPMTPAKSAPVVQPAQEPAIKKPKVPASTKPPAATVEHDAQQEKP